VLSSYGDRNDWSVHECGDLIDLSEFPSLRIHVDTRGAVIGTSPSCQALVGHFIFTNRIEIRDVPEDDVLEIPEVLYNFDSPVEDQLDNKGLENFRISLSHSD